MSVELIFNPNSDGDGEGFEVAPNHAWRQFAEWVDSEKYPALATLTGQSPIAASKVAGDITKAESDDSATEEVTAVITRLNELVADADQDAILLIE
jgi:hypothetical protein